MESGRREVNQEGREEAREGDRRPETVGDYLQNESVYT